MSPVGKPGIAERAALALEEAASGENLGILWRIDDRAEAAAAALDEAPTAGPLAGEILAVKDCFDVEGLPTTCGVAGPTAAAERDADAVSALTSAGALVIGKASMDQLGWTMKGVSPGFPPCPNPRFRGRIPGGSSAGSAAAVAAGFATLGLGTDTAGSTRIPAAYCGLAGVSLAPGMVSTRGLSVTVPRLESVGLIAATVSTCARALRALGIDLSQGVPSRPRVALLADLLDSADPEAAACCRTAVERLGGVADLGEGALDWRPPGFGRLLAAELDRTWGARIAAAPTRFSPDVLASAEVGAEIDDAEIAALGERLAVERSAVEARLAGFDVVVAPTAIGPPPSPAAASVREASTLTRAFNALRWPAVTVPVGLDAHGFSIGLQLAAPAARIGSMLALAEVVEAEVATGPTSAEVRRDIL